MNAIGLQPRHPAPTVASQGTQTQSLRLQNAETQTDHDLPDEPQQPSTSQGSQVTDGKTTLLSSGEVCHWDEKTNQSLVSFPSLRSNILAASLCKNILYPQNIFCLTNLNKFNLTADSSTQTSMYLKLTVSVYMCSSCILYIQKQHLVLVLPQQTRSCQCSCQRTWPQLSLPQRLFWNRCSILFLPPSFRMLKVSMLVLLLLTKTVKKSLIEKAQIKLNIRWKNY